MEQIVVGIIFIRYVNPHSVPNLKSLHCIGFLVVWHYS
ncbi:hypothetical protein SAMN05216388_10655 [Halorientalis persicus]|uniref:Uncharacterized protein n=1 Tax=Halorientalis persicus TaxID=1367881 RepID=A0A1H8WNT1_9EURY|nr:hypothetical protein SAMN05216388_10655 [Halorientalis persicus]